MRKGLMTILLVLMIAGIWFAAWSWSDNLTVTGVIVRGNVHVTADEIAGMFALPDSVRFSDIDLGAIQERVLRHPYVRRASVNKDFPSTIRVTIDERTPAALLVGSRMALLDADGVVMPVRHGDPMRDLAVISGSFTIPQAGDTLKHPGVENALRVIRATRAADDLVHHLFSEIRVQKDDGLLLYTAEGGVPVILGKDIRAEQLVAFREFWLNEVVPVGSNLIQSIDLRFDGQIITRWQSAARR
jgi:cell division protein FtsQ